MVNSSYFGYRKNRRRVIQSKLLDGITENSTVEDMANRFRTVVLTKDSPDVEEFDRVMTQGFTFGGVEPLTTALMDPEISKSLSKQPVTKEGFAEFVRDSREYVQDDNLSITLQVNPSAGVVTQF